MTARILAPRVRRKKTQGNALGHRMVFDSSPERAGQSSCANSQPAIFVSPFQGLGCLGTLNPGRCPGLSCSAPLGLSSGSSVPKHQTERPPGKLLQRNLPEPVVMTRAKMAITED